MTPQRRTARLALAIVAAALLASCAALPTPTDPPRPSASATPDPWTVQCQQITEAHADWLETVSKAFRVVEGFAAEDPDRQAFSELQFRRIREADDKLLAAASDRADLPSNHLATQIAMFRVEFGDLTQENSLGDGWTPATLQRVKAAAAAVTEAFNDFVATCQSTPTPTPTPTPSPQESGRGVRAVTAVGI